MAERAIDGNKNPDYNAGGQTHTDGFGSIAPWWEVDLGKSVPVEKIEVYNRKGFESRLNGFTVTLMDVLREKVFETKKIRGAERVVINLKNKVGVNSSPSRARRKSHRRPAHPLPKSKFPKATAIHRPLLLKKETPWPSWATDWRTACNTTDGPKLSCKAN